MINLGTKHLNPYHKVITALHNTPAATRLVQIQENLTTNNLSVRVCSAANIYSTHPPTCHIYSTLYLNFFMLKRLWEETGKTQL